MLQLRIKVDVVYMYGSEMKFKEFKLNIVNVGADA